MVEGDGTTSEKDEGECESGESQGKFISAVAHQSIVEVHLGDGDRHVDANRKSSHPSEQAEQNQQTTEKFGEGGKVCTPGGKAQAGDELNMVLKAAKDFMVSVVENNGAEHEAHHEKCERLQAIKVAQVGSSGGEESIAYSSVMVEGRRVA